MSQPLSLCSQLAQSPGSARQLVHPRLHGEKMGISASEPSHMQALWYLRLLLQTFSLWPCLAGKKSQPRLLYRWQADPHIPVHSSLTKSLSHTATRRHIWCPLLGLAGWATGRAEVSFKRLQRCRCGMCTQSVSPRLNRWGRLLLPRAFEVYRL